MWVIFSQVFGHVVYITAAQFSFYLISIQLDQKIIIISEKLKAKVQSNNIEIHETSFWNFKQWYEAC